MCILMNNSATFLKYIRENMNIAQPNHYFFVKTIVLLCIRMYNDT